MRAKRFHRKDLQMSGPAQMEMVHAAGIAIAVFPVLYAAISSVLFMRRCSRAGVPVRCRIRDGFER